jgi:hypothetical protein
MKSIMERQYINGRKYTSAERETADRAQLFLVRKYEVARKFFAVIWLLKLTYRPHREPFGISYLADKLTQRDTFGKYDGTSPERGSRIPDPDSLCNCPAWFSESLQVDKD